MFSNPFAPSTLTDHSHSHHTSSPITRSGSTSKSALSSPSIDSDSSRLSFFTNSSLRSPLDSSNHRASTPSAEGCFTEIIPVPDSTRRKSVDVGVLGLGYHRHGGGATTSKRMREAVGPDAGDKQIGLFGAGPKGGKDRLLGRHLASILAHSLALCADPVIKEVQTSLGNTSPTSSASGSRNPSIPSIPARVGSIRSPSIAGAPELQATESDITTPITITHVTFPTLSEAKRFKLIGSLQSWTFNAMGYSSDELLGCVGIIFESVRNMEGVDFDLDRFKSVLLSLRSAYHARNGYHNFSHATDVTQALYTFLARMGLAPPLYLLCEDDYAVNTGEGRSKWRRNRAVEEGGMGELLRPMDVFALMVAAIGHDVGHPGLSNAYMVNARTPVAQVYEDKSVLEYFHTITLMHMLRRHGFDYLLGGEFGQSGENDTSFRKVLEASILATDMSRHFAFVNEINDMGRRFGERRASTGAPSSLESDRLLLCSGLMKCADISNPTRPHRISRAWSTALLDEWADQATIEKQWNLPVTVMCLDKADAKAQAKSQVGFIDLFAKPLFNAMAGVVDEFADFAEKLRDGRTAWEAISLQSDEAHKVYVATEWKLSAAPMGRGESKSSNSTIKNTNSSTEDRLPASPSTSFTPPLSPTSQLSLRTKPSHLPLNFNRPQPGFHNIRNSNDFSPISNGFTESSLSSNTTDSTVSQPELFHPFPNDSERSISTFHASLSCDGTCATYTAMCETCSIRLTDTRRGSIGRVLAEIRMEEDETEEHDDAKSGSTIDDDWPPFPFRPSTLT